MFCSQCGTKNDEGAKFCTNCGATLEVKAAPVVKEPVVETPVVETPVVETPASEEPVYVAPAPQPTPQPTPQPIPQPAPASQPVYTQNTVLTPEQFAETPKKKKPLIPVLIALVVVIALVVGGMFILGGGYSQKTPEKAIMSFFKCIEKGDVDAFLDMIPGDEMKDLKEYMEEYDEDLDEYLEQNLEDLNDMFEDEVGKNWIDKIEITDVDIDDDYASVEVELDGEAEYLDLEKIDGKWYIDFSGLF